MDLIPRANMKMPKIPAPPQKSQQATHKGTGTRKTASVKPQGGFTNSKLRFANLEAPCPTSPYLDHWAFSSSSISFRHSFGPSWAICEPVSGSLMRSSRNRANLAPPKRSPLSRNATGAHDPIPSRSTQSLRGRTAQIQDRHLGVAELRSAPRKVVKWTPLILL